MSGFLCTLSLYLVLAYFDPHFWSSSSMAPHATPLIPNWVWLFSAIATFLAHTLGLLAFFPVNLAISNFLSFDVRWN